MRRQVTNKMILITACLVFALALSGTVAAEDSQVGGLDDNTNLQTTSEQSNNNSGSLEDDPRIYGVIKENTTPANGATITIKNPTTNSTIASGTTNSTGEYDISFVSNLTEFKVEIAYLAYKNFITTVTPTGTPIATANLNHTFMPSLMLKQTKMVLVINGLRRDPVNLLIDVYKNDLYLAGYDFELRIFSAEDLYADPSLVEKFAEELKTTNILAFYGGGTWSPGATSDIAQAVKQLQADAIIYGSGTFEGRNVTALPFSATSIFGINLNRDNIKRAYLDLLRRSNSININANDTKIIAQTPTSFLYHPDTTTEFTSRDSYLQWYTTSGKYKANAPWIGISIDPWYYYDNDLEIYNVLIPTLEARGVNVITMIRSDMSNTKIKDYFMVNGTPVIDVYIYNAHGGSGDNATVSLFKQLNVIVINPVMVYSLATLDEYLQNSTGLFGSELLAWVAAPELDGRVMPILIGGAQILGTDSITGAQLKAFAPYQPGIDQLAGQVVSWANLKHKENSDKKIALVYVDNTHDETMPVSGNLNLIESITNIIKAMAQNGYNFGSLNTNTLTSDDVLALIKDHGRNPLNYTSSDLAQLIQKGVITISMAEYLQMYNTLPQSLREQVEAMWGPPIGSIMTYEDKIVIPGIMLGNIFLGPQPIWKWNGTISSLHDEQTLPPTHQYIAFYLWMQKMFDADAMVQLGQHGTLELLPGHSTGLTEDDWPNTLIGDVPYIYLYNMANAGEANPAKRRAYAVIISYLTPPATESELYGNYAVMHDLVSAYDDANMYNNTERMEILKNQIWEKINSEAGLAERLGISTTNSFSLVYNKLHNYLHELQQMYTPYGLHIFGELPDNETLEKWLDAIIAFDPVNRTSRRDEIRNLLIQSAADEMNSLLNALNGGFIPPGVAGEVVRSLALPTGRNLYAFDPRTVPDSTATIIGKKSVEAMLERYLQANGGKYPETVAMPISGGEVMVTKGQSVASVLYLLGVKPIYNGNFVVGTEVIPLDQLGRPRIDIIIQASSSFRDADPDVMRLIDEAVKQVALLNESTELNFVCKHYLDLIPSLESDLISQGLTVADAKIQAERLARARIFSLPPGSDSHGAGVNRLLRSLDDWTEEEIAETYLNYNSYVYGKDLSGVSGNFLMERLLRTVDTTMAISYVVTPGGSYTSSGVFNFMVNKLTGRTITSYIIKTGDGNPKALTVKEKLQDDLTLTLFSPTWREGMLKQGFSGQVTIALSIRRLFTNDALVDVIGSEVWQKIANTYLFDQNMFSQLDPSAAQMITNVIYQANQRGMMQLTSSQADQLSQMMGIPVKGMSTTTPTTSTGGQSASSPGAVGRSSAGVSYQSSSAGVSSQASADVSEDGDQSAGDAGKSYEVSKATPQGAEDTPWGAYTVVGIVSVLALGAVGFFLKGGKFSQ